MIDTVSRFFIVVTIFILGLFAIPFAGELCCLVYEIAVDEFSVSSLLIKLALLQRLSLVH